MSGERDNAVIVGGGLPGMFSALVVAERHPGLKVHLVERESQLGGLYSSFSDPRAGWLDQGMHLIFESMVEDVDRHVRDALDEKDWIVLTGNHKDVAGIYHGGALHSDSPYIDVRDLPQDIREACRDGLLRVIGDKAPRAAECATADEFFRRRFGDALADKVIEPILRKLWNAGGRELDAMATRLVLIDRVRLFDAGAMSDLMKSELIRSRIAFPQQMDLPLMYRTPQRGYYPRQYGMFRVIEGLEKKLAARGVIVHTDTDLAEIVVKDREIDALRLKCGTAETRLEGIRVLHWSIPLFGLAPKLGVPLPAAKLQAPNKQVFVYLLLRHAPRMKGVYSFYCFDSGYKTFRVTDFSSYCPDAVRPDGSHPVCVELHFAPGADAAGTDHVALALRELAAFGVTGGPEDVAYSRVETPNAGFPVLTRANSAAMAQLRAQVQGLGIRNLLAAGQAPEQGIFFLHDVLEHAHGALHAYEGW